tara:strand:+ start:1131 stop:1730 length:600 start_codon:yes stop_codon:yes gene_type:complete
MSNNYFKNSSCKIENDGYSDDYVIQRHTAQKMKISPINPNVFDDSTNKKDFIKDKDGTYYTEFDGRTVDSMRNINMHFDKPPEYTNADYDSIYNTEHMCSFPNYNSINLGNIQYYQNNHSKIPFEFPVFDANHVFSSVNFRDPMDTEYVQQDLIVEHRDVIKTRPCKSENYTFLQDSQNHRDDITSSILRKYNRTKYSV